MLTSLFATLPRCLKQYCEQRYNKRKGGKDHWGDPDVDVRIILRWIFGSGRGWRLDGVGSG